MFIPYISYTLWLFNIAMENGPFIDDFPIKTSIYKGFSMAMLNNQRVSILYFQDFKAELVSKQFAVRRMVSPKGCPRMGDLQRSKADKNTPDLYPFEEIELIFIYTYI